MPCSLLIKNDEQAYQYFPQKLETKIQIILLLHKTLEMAAGSLNFVHTETLRIAYLEYGADDGWPVLLTHGFPYDVHCYDEVALTLAEAGAKVIVPYVRGFGQTSFVSDDVMRSGGQAARGSDLIQLSEALGLGRPVIGGYDWGGNASCVAAALWPEKIGGLISYASYDIIDIAEQTHSFTPSLERICWYQHLFQSERGRECLTQNRKDLCRILWKEWSPDWQFDNDIFERSATSFDNPDFVSVVIHNYRCMLGNEPGDPRYAPLDKILAAKPKISVPAITFDGTSDPLKPGGTAKHANMFTGRHEHRVINSGHNLPQEKPQAFSDAILDIHNWLAD